MGFRSAGDLPWTCVGVVARPAAMQRVGARGWALVAGISAAVALGSGGARGEPPSVSLVAVAGADALEVGRVARRLGDVAVLEAMGQGQPVAERLAAVRAAPWLDAPERALAPLVALLAGRDSELAPAAARAVATIAGALDADALARREVLPESLAPVRASLAQAAEQETLRADIRVLAGEAAFQLAAAGVP